MGYRKTRAQQDCSIVDPLGPFGFLRFLGYLSFFGLGAEDGLQA